MAAMNPSMSCGLKYRGKMLLIQERLKVIKTPFSGYKSSPLIFNATGYLAYLSSASFRDIASMDLIYFIGKLTFGPHKYLHFNSLSQVISRYPSSSFPVYQTLKADSKQKNMIMPNSNIHDPVAVQIYPEKTKNGAR